MIDLVVAFQLQSRVLCTLFTLRMDISLIAIFSFPQVSANEKEARGLLKSAVER